MRWKVTLCNQHAQCCYVGYSRTRRLAFAAAKAKASPEFLAYKLPESSPTLWGDLFGRCFTDMSRHTSRIGVSDPRGFNVQIERIKL